MERASPTTIRTGMDMASTLVSAGIAFVPMPVANDEEFSKLSMEAMARLNELYEQVKKDEENDRSDE